MIKKKRFSISSELSRGFTETINAVENDTGMFRNAIVPLSRAELDPDNPRKLALTLNDVMHGIDKHDVQYSQKLQECEKIRELANTIESSGLINPIVVYKKGDIYRVVAGERRCLASVLAGKSEIDARVYNEKPKAFELKLIQWVENTAREDLNLKERLGNIRDILKEYSHQNNGKVVTATHLSKITGISLSQASCYIGVMNGPHEVLDLIENNQLNNLDKAAAIANAPSNELRDQLIKECINGTSLKEMRKIISTKKSQEKKSKKGRAVTRINMGYTANTDVIHQIVKAVISQKPLDKYAELFKTVDWSHFKQATQAFKKLIEILEQDNKR